MPKEIKSRILEIGEDSGNISFDALNDLIPEEVKNPKTIEAIFDFMAENDITVVTKTNGPSDDDIDDSDNPSDEEATKKTKIVKKAANESLDVE
ncbi:MAG: hypothetical protein OEL55_02190, partial [Desulfobulbaceae bacterium]|nr:hypothetical protein [Desulfobulbaceae bacterium]